MHRLAEQGVRELLVRQRAGARPGGLSVARRFVEPRLVLATHNPGKLAELQRAARRPPGRGDLRARALGPARAGRGRADLRRQRQDQGARGGARHRPAGAGRQFRPRGARPGRPAGGAFGALGRAGARLRRARWRGSRDELGLRFGSFAAADRRAAFVAALCLAWPDGHEELAEGRVAGQIVDPPRGQGGFGYDPMFQPAGRERDLRRAAARGQAGAEPSRPGAAPAARALLRRALSRRLSVPRARR